MLLYFDYLISNIESHFCSTFLLLFSHLLNDTSEMSSCCEKIVQSNVYRLRTEYYWLFNTGKRDRNFFLERWWTNFWIAQVTHRIRKCTLSHISHWFKDCLYYVRDKREGILEIHSDTSITRRECEKIKFFLRSFWDAPIKGWLLSAKVKCPWISDCIKEEKKFMKCFCS